MSVEREEDIVELEISVDDSLRVEILKCEQDLTSVELRLAESELLLLDMKHEIAAGHVFHHKVDPRFGLETRVEAEKEGMALLSGGEEDSFLGLGTVVSVLSKPIPPTSPPRRSQ